MNMTSKQNTLYSEFVISDVFDIYTGATIPQLNFSNGLIPRITATDVKNGIAIFTTQLDNKNYRCIDHCISISFLWSVFYQENQVSLDMKIHAIKIKNRKLNKYIWLYLIPLIKSFSSKYNYWYQLSTSILKSQKLLLPVDVNWHPDREFMENYMKQIEQKLLSTALTYFEKKLQEPELRGGGGALNSKQWWEFEIWELFDISIWKNIDWNKIDKNWWYVPYITRKESNNGVDWFIKWNLDFKNTKYPVITIWNETATPFIQNYSFFTWTKVNIMKSNKQISTYILMFISQSIKMHKSKYSYSFTINSTRLKKQKILLPLTTGWDPDYEFMEQHMKKIEYKKVKEYIESKI